MRTSNSLGEFEKKTFFLKHENFYALAGDSRDLQEFSYRTLIYLTKMHATFVKIHMLAIISKIPCYTWRDIRDVFIC